MSTSRSGVGDTSPPGPSSAGAEPRWPMPPRCWPPLSCTSACRTGAGARMVAVPGGAAGPARAPDRPGPSRIDRRSPTLKRPRTALLVVMPAGTRARRHRPGLRHPRRRRGRHRDHPARPGRRHLGRQRDHLQPVVLAGRPGRAGRAGGRRAGPTQLRVPRERHPPSSRRQGGDRPTPTTCTGPTPTPPPSVPPTPSRSGAGPS
jgi:hypothetical protein